MSEEFFISFSDNGITGQVKVVVTDNGDGTLSFTFSQVDFVGDFRAIYFDFHGDGPDHLAILPGSFYGDNLTKEPNDSKDTTSYILVQNEDEVDEVLTSDTKMNPYGDFDVGIEVGTQGASPDDVQEVTFTLMIDSDKNSEPDGTLDINDFLSNITYGFRLTSVSDGDLTEKSVKIVGEPEMGNEPPIDPDEHFEVSEDTPEAFLGNKLIGAVDPDGDQVVMSQIMAVALDPANDPAVLAKFPGLTVELVDGAFDDGDGAEYTLTYMGAAGIATVTIDLLGDEHWSDPDNIFNALGIGEEIKVLVDYEVTDGNGGFDLSAQTLTIKGLNDAPIDLGEPCHDGGAILVENEELLAGMNLLANATDPDEDPMHVSSILLVSLTEEADTDHDFDPASITITQLDEYHYEFVGLKGISLLTIDSASGDVTLLHTDGKGAFDHMDGNDEVKISITYRVGDGDLESDPSVAEICIHGEDDIFFGELSNLVLYLSPEEGANDIIKVKFEGNEDFNALKLMVNDGDFLSLDDIEAFIASADLGGYDHLVAFSYKQGNNTEANKQLAKALAKGEGQLVYVEDGIEGFPDGVVVDGKLQNPDVETLSDIAGTVLQTGGAGNYEILGVHNYVDGTSHL